MPILLFIFAIPVVIVWGCIEMSPVRKRQRQLNAERAETRKPFCKSCASRGLDILPADRYEKIVIGKKIFIREFMRSIPAMFAWVIFSIMPLALVKDKPMLFLGGIGVVILLLIITIKFYLIHPYALLSGNFNLYGGLCRSLHVHDMYSQPGEQWAVMNTDDVDIDSMRYRSLQTGCYYYIVEFHNDKKHLFLRTDVIVAESRVNR